jgi:hypothetical protein
MHSALSVKWTTPIPGREQLALDYRVEVNEFFDQLFADGKCCQPETFVFSGGGLWTVKGHYDTLSAVYFSEESQKLLAKGEFLLRDYSFEFAQTGSSAEQHALEYVAEQHHAGIDHAWGSGSDRPRSTANIFRLLNR